MRERDVDRKMFHKGHYEVIAKRFREALTPYLYVGAPNDSTTDTDAAKIVGGQNALVSLAVDFATRLQADNNEFEPVTFLNRCSPDPENFLLGEIWEELHPDDEGENEHLLIKDEK